MRVRTDVLENIRVTKCFEAMLRIASQLDVFLVLLLVKRKYGY